MRDLGAKRLSRGPVLPPGLHLQSPSATKHRRVGIGPQKTRDVEWEDLVLLTRLLRTGYVPGRTGDDNNTENPQDLSEKAQTVVRAGFPKTRRQPTFGFSSSGLAQSDLICSTSFLPLPFATAVSRMASITLRFYRRRVWETSRIYDPTMRPNQAMQRTAGRTAF